MRDRSLGLARFTVLAICAVLLSACNTPARVGVPDNDAEIDAGLAAGRALAGQPAPLQRVRPGDTLRIVRNTGEAPSISAFTANSIYELTLFPVLSDGTFTYPYIGTVQAAGLTLPQLTALLQDKLKDVYRETAMTINISQSPGNTVFVGGAVRNTVSLPVTVGPYQDIRAILTQSYNAVQIGATLKENMRASQQIAVSTGVDDDGLFVFNFDDERYLPFEGTGAISRWRLDFPHFDGSQKDMIDSITDIIVHIRYTAKAGSISPGKSIMAPGTKRASKKPSI